MKFRLVYIGENSDTIGHFQELFPEILTVAPTHLAATTLLRAEKDEDNINILFYEKGRVKTDVPRIEYLHKHFPSAYLILVTDTIDTRERIAYLRSGINDTSSPDVSRERVESAVEFYASRLANLAREKTLRKDLREFRLPVWKRTFDIAASSLALVALSPVLLGVALAIRLESRGKVIYRSKRVGANYHTFDFLKFRSMYSDADKRLKEFNALNQYTKAGDSEEEHPSAAQEGSTAQNEEVILIADDFIISEQDYISQRNEEVQNSFVKLENDPRITKVGRFIRKYSIDELPQLINILRGDMSVVGNRPLPLYEAELLTSDEYIDRFMAPAGLTGLWQVEKRGEAGKLSAEERKQLDIDYARNYSLRLDLKIIFATLTAFIQKENV